MEDIRDIARGLIGGVFTDEAELAALAGQDIAAETGFYCDLFGNDARRIAKLAKWALDGEPQFWGDVVNDTYEQLGAAIREADGA